MRLKFQSKVVMPVVTVMALLLALSLWIFNQSFTAHFYEEGRQKLSVADAVFTNSMGMRSRFLESLYAHVANAPKVKAVLQNGDPKTVAVSLRDLLEEERVDWALFSGRAGRLAAHASAKPSFDPEAVAARCRPAVSRALAEGAPSADSIRLPDGLFDVVSIPVFLETDLLGALTFGVRFGATETEEFKQQNQTEIVFLDRDGVIASTLGNPALYPRFLEAFTNSPARKAAVPPGGGIAPRELTLDQERFLYKAGQFQTLNGGGGLGYLLLYSNAGPLRALRSTQKTLLGFSLLGILAGAVTVSILVRKVTEPLRELRNAAEAVGRGDFSHRAAVRSADEFGDLAASFNQMTANLKNSREELEKTVETLGTTRAQLVQSEKLSAIGEFVAGVAHELNNPLTSVIGFSELLGASETNPANRAYFGMITESAHRCGKIVQGLLSFARQHPPERKLVDLGELIEAALGFVQYELRTGNIDVVRHFSPDLPRVLADPHQLQQVFLNLINNARQAMESRPKHGCLRVSTEVVDGKARVTIQDNGPGISPQNLAKIFDPFFTTKPVGKGTGLGLSLTYGIVREHEGTIHALSPPGEGATFIIEIPVPGPGQSAIETVPAPSAGAGGAAEGRGKRILVVDDEVSILKLARSILGARGYEVETAEDGERALSRLKESSYDLVLCDWKMPGTGGREVFERLRLTDPAAASRVIFMTGDVMNTGMEAFLHTHKLRCVAKPFGVEELRETVQQFMSPSLAQPRRT